ncbi:MAG: AAA family ATPase [Pseudomonadota bacterium]|nr:AAA family ATPase [Pseudomonadota bacterium]
MPVLAVLNQKGGVGKTTLATHIAMRLSELKQRVLLIDADQQGSSLDWKAARGDAPAFTVVGLPKDSIHREIGELAKDYDWVVIDGPPRVSTVAKSAIAASDMVLIPVQPSPYDVWAAKDIVDLIVEVRVLKEDLKAVFTVNRKVVGTAIGRDVSAALANFPVAVLKSFISQRVGFAESAASGRTVLEVEPKGPGAKEVRGLVNEIMEHLDGR